MGSSWEILVLEGKFWNLEGNFQKFCLFVHKNTLQIVRKLASFLGNKKFFLLCPLKKHEQTNKNKNLKGTFVSICNFKPY